MALNKEVFKTRSLTAVVFVVVMLLGLFWNFWSFFVLFTVIHFGCWYEYLKLVELISKSKIDNVIKWFFAICGYTLVIVLGIWHYRFDFFISIISQPVSFKLIFWIFLLVCLVIVTVQNKQLPERAKWMSLAGLIYISLSLALLLNLRDRFFIDENEILIDNGRLIPCAIIFSIWINDTMAYIVGSLIGKTPFSKISPKKTWEGTAGGAILCVVVIGLLGYFIPAAKQIAVHHWVAIAAICAIFGTAGDLLESKIKRMADVKDSGSFMPGHGGFLDRFDSLLVATPFVWLYVTFFT